MQNSNAPGADIGVLKRKRIESKRAKTKAPKKVDVSVAVKKVGGKKTSTLSKSKTKSKQKPTTNNHARSNNVENAPGSSSLKQARKPRTGTSKYKGVCWNKSSRRWRARINNASKIEFIGDFKSEVDAARAYDKRSKEVYGRDNINMLNFPDTSAGKRRRLLEKDAVDQDGSYYLELKSKLDADSVPIPDSIVSPEFKKSDHLGNMFNFPSISQKNLAFKTDVGLHQAASDSKSSKASKPMQPPFSFQPTEYFTHQTKENPKQAHVYSNADRNFRSLQISSRNTNIQKDIQHTVDRLDQMKQQMRKVKQARNVSNTMIPNDFSNHNQAQDRISYGQTTKQYLPKTFSNVYQHPKKITIPRSANLNEPAKLSQVGNCKPAITNMNSSITNTKSREQLTRKPSQQQDGTSFTGSSRYKGVCWNKRKNKWRARLSHKGKREFLGDFEDEQKAALAYDERVKQLFHNCPERLNFPELVGHESGWRDMQNNQQPFNQANSSSGLVVNQQIFIGLPDTEIPAATTGTSTTNHSLHNPSPIMYPYDFNTSGARSQNIIQDFEVSDSLGSFFSNESMNRNL